MKRVDYVAVVCGKMFILDMWHRYLLKLPTDNYPGNLIVVNNTSTDNVEYNTRLYELIHSKNIINKFDTVKIVSGPGTDTSNRNKSWRHPDVNSKKHDSTAIAFTLGFEHCVSELVVTIDDDTFIVDNGLCKLLRLMEQDSRVGGVSGLYLTKDFLERGELKVNGTTHVDREIVLSVNTEQWTACDIVETYNTGIIDAGYFGTGCAVWRTSQVKKNLPLYTDTSGEHNIGPDGVLCEKIRINNKLLCDTSVLATHWNSDHEHNPVEVGVGVNSVKHNNITNKTTLCVASWAGVDERIETLISSNLIARELKIDHITMLWPNNIADKIISRCDINNLNINKPVTIIPVDTACIRNHVKNVPMTGENKKGEQTQRARLLKTKAWEVVFTNKYSRVICMLPECWFDILPKSGIECLYYKHSKASIPTLDDFRCNNNGITRKK